MARLPPNRKNLLQQFFMPVRQDVISNPNKRLANNFTIGKGSLISFNYTFWRNDAYPLIIVCENNKTDNKLCGINIHYLTFPYIKKLLGLSVNNPTFSYKSLGNDDYLRSAYRSYKRIGIRQVKILDYKFLINIMNMVRSYDPAEVQIIRRQVQEQIRRQTNPKAEQLTNLNQPETE